MRNDSLHEMNNDNVVVIISSSSLPSMHEAT